VGVVKDGKAVTLREEQRRFVFLSHAQREVLGGMTFYARTAGEPDALMGRVNALVSGVDPDLPVSELKTMRAQVRESLFVERMVATLVRVLRHPGHAAGRARPVRRDGLRGGPAHARDRDPDGAGRAAP
jgi:hypothetical protein